MGSSDRRPYLSWTGAITQAFLDEMSENLDFGLEMVADITTPTSGSGGTIRASDRNKYVGSVYYKAIINFPPIKRSLGRWLDPTIEFSDIQLSLSNVDGNLSNFLPEGADFDSFVGESITVRIGVRDDASSFFDLFEGSVTPVGGFERQRRTIDLTARDSMDKLNATFPNTAIRVADWPDVEEQFVGLGIPVIYGDFTTAFRIEGRPEVPAFPVNGADPDVNGDSSRTTDLRLLVSENDNRTFDTSGVVLKRGSDYYPVASADVTVISGNRVFDIAQGGSTMVDGAAWEYEPGDEFVVTVEGKDVGSYDDNFVEIARDLLLSYGGAVSGDFDSNWNTYRDKSTPSESAIVSMPCRVWQQEGTDLVPYVLSLLEQVRLEMFVDRNLKLKLNSMHFEDFVVDPSFNIRQWDLVMDQETFSIDDVNNFNRVRAEYARSPQDGKQNFSTGFYRNQDAIDQNGLIERKIEFPNHYVESHVVNQTKEILKLASANPEYITIGVNQRALLLDNGGYAKLNFTMGSLAFTNSPIQIREVQYAPDGSVTLVALSLQMVNYPGHIPGHAGIVGGHNATITAE